MSTADLAKVQSATDSNTVAHLKKMLLGQLRFTDSQSSRDDPGHYLAVDCEMVGIGPGGFQDSLARVSIVNFYGAVMLDTFVRQTAPVTDYRTRFSGVRREDVESASARPFSNVQSEVISLVNHRILIGHTLDKDLSVLGVRHPPTLQRDVKENPAWRRKYPSIRRHGLKMLVQSELGVAIQGGEHDSVTDARAALALFRLYEGSARPGILPLQTSSAGSSEAVPINFGVLLGWRAQRAVPMNQTDFDDDFEDQADFDDDFEDQADFDDDFGPEFYDRDDFDDY